MRIHLPLVFVMTLSLVGAPAFAEQPSDYFEQAQAAFSSATLPDASMVKRWANGGGRHCVSSERGNAHLPFEELSVQLIADPVLGKVGQVSLRVLVPNVTPPEYAYNDSHLLTFKQDGEFSWESNERAVAIRQLTSDRSLYAIVRIDDATGTMYCWAWVGYEKTRP